MAHDNAGNSFVNYYARTSHRVTGIAKISQSGQILWQAEWPDSTDETNPQQLVYDQADNSLIAATIEELGEEPEVVVRFDATNGHKIWQTQINTMALQIWKGYVLAWSGGFSTGTMSLLKNTDGSVASSFTINSPSGLYFSGYPMMRVLGDTMLYVDNTFFAKFSLPSGQMIWQVLTTDFAQEAQRTYGELDAQGNAYISTSDLGGSQDTTVPPIHFAAAKYSSDGRKMCANRWLGWSDTSLAYGFPRYNLNSWVEGTAFDESLQVFIIYGGVQRYGTAGYEGNQQSAYLAVLNAKNCDTLITSKWDDSTAAERAHTNGWLITVWDAGYFDAKDQLVLLSNSGASETWAGGGISESFIKTFQMNTVTGVKPQPNEPSSFRLSQNYPNPFNPTTTISFHLPQRSFVTLRVFDIMGREISTIILEELPSGNYTKQWNASALSSGVYFYRLQAGSFTETKKLVLLK